jgi:hypothetical protein
MSIILAEGFDTYAGEKPRSSVRMPVWLRPQHWWRRLWRMDRPPQTVIIGFSFKAGELHHIETKIRAPAGIDAAVIEIAFIDGKPIDIMPDLYLAHSDTEEGKR